MEREWNANNISHVSNISHTIIRNREDPMNSNLIETRYACSKIFCQNADAKILFSSISSIKSYARINLCIHFNSFGYLQKWWPWWWLSSPELELYTFRFDELSRCAFIYKIEYIAGDHFMSRFHRFFIPLWTRARHFHCARGKFISILQNNVVLTTFYWPFQ